MRRGSKDDQKVVATVLEVEPERWYMRLLPRSWWGKALVLLVIVVVAGAAWALYGSNNKPVNNQTTSSTQATVTPPPDNISPEQKAEYLANEGQYQAAEQAYQQQLVGNTDPSSEVAVYYEQSSLAVQNKRYSDAKKYADEALQVDPSSPTPYVAEAQVAQAQGNYSLAKQDYQAAINHVTTDMPGYNLIINDYQTDLKAVP